LQKWGLVSLKSILFCAFVNGGNGNNYCDGGHVLNFKPMPDLRKGWRAPSNQTNFDGRLSGGYGNDTVSVNSAGAATSLVDMTEDKRDTPASPLEGNDSLSLSRHGAANSVIK
jgi:hypothetical protein